jgi:hypothetical protein
MHRAAFFCLCWKLAAWLAVQYRPHGDRLHGEMLCPGRERHLKRQARTCVISLRPMDISVLTPRACRKVGSVSV